MHIAQFNAAEVNFPLEHHSMREFVDNLGRVNDIARTWPGFVWKLQDDTGHSANIRTQENPNMAINLSVWESTDALRDFMTNSAHHYYYKNRRNWFKAPRQAHSVLWYVPVGHFPSLDEAWDRLEMLRRNGPSEEAFTFAQAGGFQPDNAGKVPS